MRARLRHCAAVGRPPPRGRVHRPAFPRPRADQERHLAGEQRLLTAVLPVTAVPACPGRRQRPGRRRQCIATCAVVPPTAGLRPKKNEPAIATTERTAATTNAVCTPPAVCSITDAPSAARSADRTLSTLTSRATPAAPASCWAVPTIALP